MLIINGYDTKNAFSLWTPRLFTLFFIYMSIYLHFTLRKKIDKKTDIQNYTIARYQYTGKYLGV